MRSRLPALSGLEDLTLATAVAVGIGFALVLLPTGGHDYVETAAAGLLGLALVALAQWERGDAVNRRLVVAVGYVLFAALLRDSEASAVAGFGGLFFLPAIWLALKGTQRELLIVLAAVAAALATPLAVDQSRYPDSAAAASAVLLGATIVVAFVIRSIHAGTSRAAHRAQAHATELREANEALRQLDQVKDEFIGIVSHELRTPLTSIAGFLELVLDEPQLLTPEHRDFLTTVSRNVDRLTLLVNDLLLLAVADNGRLALKRTDFEPDELVREIEQAARPHAEAEAIRFSADIDTLPLLNGDRARLAQLLDNLVSNAIKYTPAGGSVSMRAWSEGDDVVIEVSDSGIGIPEAEIPRLFDRFYRASTATDQRFDGTGLGLAISKTIADAHRGSIDVTSEIDEGTTFRLRLPAGSARAAPHRHSALAAS